MDTLRTHQSHCRAAGWVEGRELEPCCEATIRSHVVYNPMMLCQGCKQLIKCFKNEASFRNYTVFCSSRERRVYTAKFDEYFVVTFQKHESWRK